MKDAEHKIVHRERILEKNHKLYIMIWDQLTAALAIDPSGVVKSQTVHATVELAGNRTRGMLVVDWLGLLKQSANVKLIQEVNMERFEELLYSGIQ